LTEDLRRLNEKISNLPAGTKAVIQRLYIITAQSWVNMPEGRQAAYALVGIFVGIHLLKTVGFGKVKAFFTKNFVHDPLSGRSFTLLTSNFGHDGFLHLAVNSVALLGFGMCWLHPYVHHLIIPPQVNTLCNISASNK
jgi:rhomboid-like protein